MEPCEQHYIFSFPIPYQRETSFSSPEFTLCDKVCSVYFSPQTHFEAPHNQYFWKVSIYFDTVAMANPFFPSVFIPEEIADRDYKVLNEKLYLDIHLRGELRDITRGVILFPTVHPFPRIEMVELRIRLRRIQPPRPVPIDEVKNYQIQIGKELLDLLRGGSYCDVVLSVNGYEIEAHRILLAAHSPVFKTMFETDMMEKKSCRVEIVDLEPEGVKAMVEFMYSPSLENSVFQSCPLAIETYKCAHKYQVDLLKDKCSSYLQKSMDDSTALDVLQLASIYSEAALKDNALKYLMKHPNAAEDLEKCQSVIASCPEIFRFMIQNCIPKK